MKIVITASLVAANAAAFAAYASLPPDSSSFVPEHFEMHSAPVSEEAACRPFVPGGLGIPNTPMAFREVIVMKQGRHVSQVGDPPTAEC